MVRSKTARAANRWLIFFLVVVPVGPAISSPVQPPSAVGTFSSFRFIEESGDVHGVEVRIAPTPSGLQAVTQVAEGEPGPLNVVAVSLVKDEVTFEIPLDQGVSGRFNGKVTKTGLVGQVKWPSGAERMQLKRGKSYWDRLPR